MGQPHEYIYIGFICLIYFRLRSPYSTKSESSKYNSFLLPIELLIFFSIFDNFLALPFGINLKLPFVAFIIYSFFTFKSNFRYNKNFKYFFLFLIFLITSSIWVENDLHVLFRIIFILSWVLLLISLQSLLARFKDYSLLIKNICIIGLINGMVGIIEFLLYFTVGFKLPFPLISHTVDTHPDLFARSFGFMFEPNWYGLLQIFFFVVYVFLYKKISFVGICIFLVSIIVTGNKITTLCLLPILYHIFFHHEIFRSKSKKLITFFFLSFTAFSLYSFIQEILIERFTQSFSYLANNDAVTITSNYDRFVYIKYLIIGFIEEPILGHGLNSSIIIHNLIPWLNKNIDEIPASATVQSGIFRLLYEQGIIGFLFFIFVFKKIYKYTIDRKFFKWFLFVFLVHMVFYDIWNVLYSMPLFFLIILIGKESSHFSSRSARTVPLPSRS